MKRVSLAEIMGSSAAEKGEGLKLSHLPKILGDAMPEMPKNSLGRHRLIRALQQRFGDNFRSLPGVKDLVKEFDDEIDFEKRIERLRGIRVKASK